MSPALNISQSGVTSALSRVLHSGRVWTIHGVGSLVWFALAFGWFRIGRDDWVRLTGAILLAIVLAYLGAFLQRTALRVYRRNRLSALGPGRRRGKIHHRKLLEWLPDAAFVFVLFIALAGLYGVILQALTNAVIYQPSWLALFLSQPARYETLALRATVLEFIGLWALFVLIWMPIEAAALLAERSMWKAAIRAWRRPRYWFGTFTSYVVGYLAIWRMTLLFPQGSGTEGPAAGIGLLVLGYAIVLGAWLMILALAEEAIASAEPRSVDDTWD